ncbi:hypothetical protein [Microbacterium sp. 2FI]|uniref:hypothetical protein n=1 Tax=Microbacterium sp. 2FI TaxID=2502193 RepID=UPI0010F6AA5A|nr:hypothetical protein [Microbacterium sp. 2FI]
MDAIGALVLGIVLAATLTLIILAPRLKRDHLRRQLDGTAGGSLAGVGSGMDAVWRPSAEDAHARWEAQVELPAPAPTPGDKGRLDDGRIIIDVAG